MNAQQRVITDTDKSALIQVLALMFLVVGILACSVRVGTKLYMIKTLKADDLITIVAITFATGQTAATYIGAEHGLGRPFDSLGPSEVDSFFKSQYAANVLFIAALLGCKLSGTMGLRLIVRNTRRFLVLGLDIFAGIWGGSALIVSLFQCQLPTPWLYTDASKCINRTSFYTYYSVLNIITDIAIVAVVCDNILRLQTNKGNKALVIIVFGSRILITPVIAVQIYYSNKAFASLDHSFDIWQATVAIQLVQCLAVFAACLPNFKLFLDSVESGQIRMDDLRRQGKSTSSGYPENRRGYAGYKSQNSNGGGSQSQSQSQSQSRSRTQDAADGDLTMRSQISDVHEMADFSKTKMRRNSSAAGNSGGASNEQNGKTWDGQSHTSQTILIHQTWEVDSQSVHDAGRR